MVYEAEKGNFTIALAGDTMLTRKLMPFKEERFLKLREVLRSALLERRSGGNLGAEASHLLVRQCAEHLDDPREVSEPVPVTEEVEQVRWLLLELERRDDLACDRSPLLFCVDRVHEDVAQLLGGLDRLLEGEQAGRPGGYLVLLDG